MQGATIEKNYHGGVHLKIVLTVSGKLQNCYCMMPFMVKHHGTRCHSQVKESGTSVGDVKKHLTL